MEKVNCKTLFAVALLAVAVTDAHATSWRINNDVTKHAHFTDINAAMASEDVVAGDTLYLDPGCALGSEQTITKQVTIVGTGYFRTGAPHVSAVLVGQLNINAAGTKLTGVILNGTNNYINAANVTMERCNINGNHFYVNSTYTTIRQCFVCAQIQGKGESSNASMGCIIENNIIETKVQYGCIRDFYIATIRNNYMRTNYSSNTSQSYNYAIYQVKYSQINNNIISVAKNKNWVLYDVENCTLSNNLLSCDEGTYPAYPDNVCLGTNNMSSVICNTGSNDEMYQLAEESPAKGAANDGGDCGPFDGGYPYVLSGLPLAFPYYTQANVGSVARDGKVNVSFQIKMQNE